MKVIKSLRAPVLVTLVLLLICGLIYPVVMTLMSQALFPSQANGSIIYVDGQAVGAKNVGQDFTDPRFMRCRPSAYQYNTYTVDEEGNKFYNDGSEYAGVASGSNNYGASNPALAERVQGDIDEFLAEHPDLTVEDRPGDGLRFRPGSPHQPCLCGCADSAVGGEHGPDRGAVGAVRGGQHHRQGAGHLR